MKVRSFVLKPDQRDHPLSALGTHFTVPASSDATQSYGVSFQHGDEGTGPPPHSHDWYESLYVLTAGIEFPCDGRDHMCLPGTLVHVARGTVYGFRFGRGDDQVLEVTEPGALAARCSPLSTTRSPSGP